jgi:hypothetical protein
MCFEVWEWPSRVQLTNGYHNTKERGAAKYLLRNREADNSIYIRV